MSKRTTKFLLAAADRAASSTSTINHKHGAIVVSSGKIMADGINTTNTSPFAWISGSSKFTHAEFDALLNYAKSAFSTFHGRNHSFEKPYKGSSQDGGGCFRGTCSYDKWEVANMQLQAMPAVY